MKHLQWLLATACMLAVCLSVSAQSGKKVKVFRLKMGKIESLE